MEVFRISHKSYSNQLSSSGASSRWNKRNEFVIYTGASRSLSTLEVVVHRNSIHGTSDYEVMIISIADEESLFENVSIKDLPSNWRDFKAYPLLQQIGSDWYREQRSLVIKVPSAIISQEYNYIINTHHPLFKDKVQLVRNESYFFDGRLL